MQQPRKKGGKHKMSKGGQILILIIIIGVIVFIVYSFFVSKEGTMMSVRMYDKDGKLLRDTAYSIVGGTPGVAQIDLTVTVTNTGSQALTCNLQTLGPTAFNTAMTKTEKQVLAGGKIAWTSAKISVAQFESASPTSFTAPVICSYSSTILPTKTGSLSLLITAEAVSGGAYDVSVSPGGVGTEYCGDTICQASETASSCPADCTLAPTNVKFRTNDITYVSGSDVGYTSTCGNNLIGYGYLTEDSSWYGGPNPTTVTYPLGNIMAKAYALPGGWISGGNPATLYTGGTGVYVAICDDDNIASGQHKCKYYSTTSFVTGSVDLTKSSINPAKEVGC